MGKQININGKDEVVEYINKGYSRLGISKSPRMIDLAINDIKNLLEGESNLQFNSLDYETKLLDVEFREEVNLFEGVLTKIKTKIKKNEDNAVEHYDYFITFLYKLKDKLDNNKNKLENYNALIKEWYDIEKLIISLKNKNVGEIIEWYTINKKSKILYEVYKNEGFNDEQIQKIMKYANSLKFKYKDS